jgi:hypothetical protein
VTIGFASLAAPLAQLFPEANIVAGKEGPGTAAAILKKPDDLLLRVIEGKQASNLISDVLSHEDVRTLLGVLPAYSPVIGEARVQSGAWQRGRHRAVGVSIPLIDAMAGEAALLYVETDGVPSSVLVEFPNPADRTNARIHVASGGRVTDVDTLAAAATTACTVDCLLRCLPLYGCSGLALTLCTAALLTCPFFFPTCFAAWGCTLYCGGAFAQCNCWCHCTC